MCVLSIKVPIRKKSGNLFNDSRTYTKSLYKNNNKNINFIFYSLYLESVKNAFRVQSIDEGSLLIDEG